MIESWMVSLFISAVVLIGNIFIMRYSQAELKKNQHVFFKRLDHHGDDIIELKTKSELAMTSRDVDDKYVSKELFRQFEKHIDKRFDALEKGQGEILDYIRDKKR